MNKSSSVTFKHKNIPAVLLSSKMYAADAGYFIQPHWHDGIEILFFKDGVAENLIDGKVIQETAGDIILINSGTLHSTRAVSEVVSYYCLIIKKEACNEFGFSTNDQYIQTKINDPRLFSLVNEIHNEFSAEKEYYTAVVTAKILELFTILFRDYSYKKTNSKQNSNLDTVKKGLQYIEANFTKQITVDDVAASTGYSKYYFCRFFKEITKSTVNSYINRMRIDLAVKLLSEKGLSVGETAIECGFNDISYFTKTFKKYTSQLPSQVKPKLWQIKVKHYEEVR